VNTEERATVIILEHPLHYCNIPENHEHTFGTDAVYPPSLSWQNTGYTLATTGDYLLELC